MICLNISCVVLDHFFLFVLRFLCIERKLLFWCYELICMYCFKNQLIYLLILKLHQKEVERVPIMEIMSSSARNCVANLTRRQKTFF